ncbi:MAG: hypothetical protein D4S01_03525 [Dehalococcoidia bacterium]|nr:MAG: hypothetical protein D4S01_03525 [Dehalococcoidia bacterium]
MRNKQFIIIFTLLVLVVSGLFLNNHSPVYADSGATGEVVVAKPIEPREFTSLEELKSWLAEDDTNECIHLVAGEDGVCPLDVKYDCDDYALQLQRQAARSGFLMSVAIIEERGKPHMINLACIGNDICYIEPQTDEVWFYCHRD